MGVRILTTADGDHACLYCSTTDWAFGPVFYAAEYPTADERATAFLAWIDQAPSPYERVLHGDDRRDVRTLSEQGLERAYHDWLTCEAREQTRTVSQHLAHLAVHGFLHLLGYDHQTDQEAEHMETLEREVLATLGISDPYASHDA